MLSRAHLSGDVPALDDVLAVVHQRIDALPATTERRLVHGDYFPGNVMIGDDLAITSVTDFGSMTLIGDPLMDVASAIAFLEAVRPLVAEDAAHLTWRAARTHGSDFVETMRNLPRVLRAATLALEDGGPAPVRVVRAVAECDGRAVAVARRPGPAAPLVPLEQPVRYDTDVRASRMCGGQG